VEPGAAAPRANDRAHDSTSETFGIRSIEWGASFGLRLNGETIELTLTPTPTLSLGLGLGLGLSLSLSLTIGKPIKLRGGCVHHDNGPLGAATIDRAETRRVELLKANGAASTLVHRAPRPAHRAPHTAHCAPRTTCLSPHVRL
jgi:hypothetical protein